MSKAKRIMNERTQNVSTVIMKRFMSEKELAEFYERYEAAKLHQTMYIWKPSENDKKIVNHFKKEMSISRTAEAMGISTSRVYGAIARVEAYRE